MNIKFNDFQTEIKDRGKEYQAAISRVLNSGWFILGPEVSAFETEFASFLGVKHCIGVANGLEALQISLMALGVGPRDEVITTPVSAVATTLAIIAVGAKPVFVDVSKGGLLNPQLLESAITSRTKAILPVHLYGQPLDLGAIIKVCKKHKLYLVEDACQAHGTTYQGKVVGSVGHINCFSFYPTKNVGAFGDGGAIVTNDDNLAKICQEVRDYGQQSKYIHTRYGLNSRLDEIQAAILRVKLSYLNRDNHKRRSLAKAYIQLLADIPELDLIVSPHLANSNFHLFTICTPKRNELQAFLKTKNIPSLIHYPITIPDQPLFLDKYKNLDIPIARNLVQTVLSLPCHPQMRLSDVKQVAATIHLFFKK